MSVIFGKYHINKSPLPKSDLEKMQHRLNHWNADDSGIWKNDFVGFGHLMLWNTPESLYEKLPFTSPYSGNVITADARIDNREELFTKLKITDHTVTDSFLILEAYDKYGKDCVHHLIGDFAFAIWNKHKEELFCARDHMGVRPFFYYYDGECFAWASEMKGLLCLDEVSLELNKAYFMNAFYNVLNQNNITSFKNIEQIEQAHYLVVSTKGISIKKYWDLDPSYELKRKNEQEYYDEYLFLIEDAIEKRMRTHYPLGSQLSGGLDSSGIVGVVTSKLKNNNNFHTFTHAILEKNRQKYPQIKDERPYVEKTKDFLNLKNTHFVSTRFNSYWNYIDEKNRILGGPFERCTAEMILDLIQETPKYGIRTMLSGFYGDNFVTHNGRGMTKQLVNELKYLQLYKHYKTGSRFPLYHTVKYITKHYLNLNKINHKYSFSEVPLKKEYHDEKILTQRKNLYKYFTGKTVREQMYNEFQMHGSNKRLYLENLIAQSARLEMRYPFVDIRLLQFCLSLPSSFHIKTGIKRYIYRKTMNKYIHPDIISIKKISFMNIPSLLSIFWDENEDIYNEIEKLKLDSRYNYIDCEKILKRIIESKEIPEKVTKSIQRDHLFFSLYRYQNISSNYLNL